MEKNVAGQTWVVFAFDRTNNEPETGGAAAITANLRIDGGGANAVDDTYPTELEDGYYIFDLTQAETNGDNIVISPASGTGNIQVIGCPAAVYTRPPNFNSLGIESDGDLEAVTLSRSNTDMRGTDIGSLNNISTAEVNAQCDQALSDYDGPTRAEATSDKDEIIVEVDANETKIDAVKAETVLILEDTADMQPRVEAIEIDTNSLNDTKIPDTISLAAINTEVDNALNTAIPGSPTGDSINDYIMRMKYVMVNQIDITEADGNTVIYKDNDSTEYCSVAAAYTSDSTTTTRKRLE